MYKQLIIARKDLNMSSGKLAAQVSHGSMAFLTSMIKANTQKLMENQHPAWRYYGEERKPQFYKRQDLNTWSQEARDRGEDYFYARPVNPALPYAEMELCEPTYIYRAQFDIDNDLYEQWINGSFTKIVCEARNRNQLLKAVTIAEELGLQEGKDFFLIKDNCLTELQPEETDGCTLTCIGFAPLPEDVVSKISKKYQLYK